MKVEIVSIEEFASPVALIPGDVIRVSHIVKGVEYKKSQQDIPEPAIWTHSILFRLDGQLNHIIGDQVTIDWLDGQLEDADA